MKILIDADCPRSIGKVLKDSGHKVIDIRDIKANSSDQEIYELIKRKSFIFITRHTDFGNILRYPATSNCGIILLRTYLLSVSEITTIIKDFFSRVTEKQLLGGIAVIQKGRCRFHRI